VSRDSSTPCSAAKIQAERWLQSLDELPAPLVCDAGAANAERSMRRDWRPGSTPHRRRVVVATHGGCACDFTREVLRLQIAATL